MNRPDGRIVSSLYASGLAGALGFYKGMHTKIVQSILAAALLMAIKEKVTQAALLLLRPPQKPALELVLTTQNRAAKI